MKNENWTEEEFQLYRSCCDCMYVDQCQKHKDCEYLSPTENNAASQEAMLDAELTRMVTPPSQVMKKITYGRRDPLLSDGGATLWEYYAGNVNECLKTLREGRIAYCYNLQVLQGIMRYEPDVKVQWQDNTYYLRLNQ